MEIERLNNIHGNTVIWRYMSFEKFLDVCISQTLFFSNASTMEDKYEVQIPPKSIMLLEKDLISKGKSKEEVELLIKKNLNITKALKRSTYINCWSLNKAESYALWKIFLGGVSNGIAIKSTISKFEQSLQFKNFKNLFPLENWKKKASGIEFEKLKIGKVEYKEFLELIEISKTRTILTKREFYEYENEIRAFLISKDQYNLDDNSLYESAGVSIPIDIDTLINEIVISPFSPNWFRLLIESTVNKLLPSLKSKIRNSEIMV
ncbi:MAG: hypothetical protein ACXIUQ_12450 [Cecembia sp.]